MLKRLLSTKSNLSIQITDSAWNRISSILEQTKGASFIFSAKGGGCGGYNYEFRSVDQDEFDTLKNYSKKIKPIILKKDNSKVIIDPVSEFLLSGTIIDYFESIYEKKFVFNRDKQIASSCGCGTSFNLK